MDDKNNQAVISLTSHKTNNVSKAEVESARNCLSILSWDMQVQQVAGLCGLSVTQSILEGDAAPIPGSHADNLGHKSLRQLVESSSDTNGLGVKWEDFEEKLTARVYRDRFAIQESDFTEINKLVNDVKSELGRMPHDASEFHGTKQKVLLEKIESIKSDFEANNKSMQETQRQLMKQNTQLSEETQKMKLRMDEALNESAMKIQEAYREAARKIEESELLAETQKAALQQELENQSKQKIAQAEKEYKDKLKESEQALASVQSDLSALENKIASGELVNRETISVLKADLERAVSEELKAKRLSDELRGTISSLEKTIDQMNDATIQEINKHNETRKHIEELESQLRESVENRLKGSEYAIYQERLVQMREKNTALSAEIESKNMLLEKAEAQRNELNGRYEEYRSEGSKYTQKLQLEISENREKIGKYKKQIAGLVSNRDQLTLESNAFREENRSLKRTVMIMIGLIMVVGMTILL